MTKYNLKAIDELYQQLPKDIRQSLQDYMNDWLSVLWYCDTPELLEKVKSEIAREGPKERYVRKFSDYLNKHLTKNNQAVIRYVQIMDELVEDVNKELAGKMRREKLYFYFKIAYYMIYNKEHKRKF